MKECGKFPLFANWQEGYGAFTYSIREREMIVNYIRNQKAHHQQENFSDEYKRLLQENEIDFDERFYCKSSLSLVMSDPVFSHIGNSFSNY